jgi:hypothetical protein
LDAVAFHCQGTALRAAPALVGNRAHPDHAVDDRADRCVGYRNPEDLRSAYPGFFWKAVNPYIGDALDYLRVTQEGKLWIANLYAHVFSEEHRSAIRTQ